MLDVGHRGLGLGIGVQGLGFRALYTLNPKLLNPKL